MLTPGVTEQDIVDAQPKRYWKGVLWAIAACVAVMCGIDGFLWWILLKK